MNHGSLRTSNQPKSSGLIRSSAIYSGFTLVSRFAGFLRDLAVSYTMGASATFAADAFNTAWSFPNLFRRIFAEGAFAAAFVPAYSRSLETDGEEVADVLAADAMATLAAATLVVTVVAELTMPWLMYLIAPGFASNPEKFKLAIFLTQITMPYLPCMAIYAHLSGVLNARNRFILSAAAPVLLNLWTLATVLPTHTAHDAAVWGSIGIVLAGISQAALLWWGVRRSGARVDLRWPRLTPEIKKLISLAIPGAIAASATQISVFVSGILVSQVNGARSWLFYCDRLYQLPQGLIGVAIGVALLPRLSRTIHAGDETGARTAMDQALIFSMALALPCAVALITIPFFLIDALYTRGAFTVVDAHQTANALFFYGWGVPAFVAAQLFNRAFFARQDTATPMRLGLVSVAVNVIVGISLFYLIGVPGVAAATTIAWWTNVVMMATTLARRSHYRPDPVALGRFFRILLANVLLAALLLAANHFRPQIQGLFGHIRIFK
ncbi:MAG TPA: murein biosynthesis integral membrane protein MurJ, partial [Phenylobacterium sp.]|nr:murein biosynthesis integral membrane protein MurJ [Phenylobacterium sp.]